MYWVIWGISLVLGYITGMVFTSFIIGTIDSLYVLYEINDRRIEPEKPSNSLLLAWPFIILILLSIVVYDFFNILIERFYKYGAGLFDKKPTLKPTKVSKKKNGPK